jgi:hypothetical protein
MNGKEEETVFAAGCKETPMWKLRKSVESYTLGTGQRSSDSKQVLLGAIKNLAP